TKGLLPRCPLGSPQRSGDVCRSRLFRCKLLQITNIFCCPRPPFHPSAPRSENEDCASPSEQNLISIKYHFLITTSFSLDGVVWPCAPLVYIRRRRFNVRF